MKARIIYDPNRKLPILEVEGESESEELALQLLSKAAFRIHLIIENDDPANFETEGPTAAPGS